MDKHSAHQALEKLQNAYQKTLHWMQKNIKEWYDSERYKKLDEHLAQAKQKMIEIEHLTEEEAHKVAEYLERDMHEAAYFLNDAKKWLVDWLYFDYKTIEQDLWQAFTDVANKTALEYQQFNYDLKHGFTYHADEIIGLGSLQCSSCQHVLHFKQVSTIPKCPKCSHDEFARVSI